jgi:AP-1 complex subunit beta-1
LDTFQEETSQVQLQLLTATVKLFLKSPDNSKEMMESVLAMATEESDNPDLRDRGYVYWRLLSTDPDAARQVVLAEKPIIDGDTFDIESSLLEELIANISTLASVYHKPPDAFAPRKTGISKGSDDSDDSDDSDSDQYEDSDSDSGSDSDSDSNDDGETKSSKKKGKSKAEAAPAPAAPQSSMEDLLGLGGLDMGSGGAATASTSNNGGSNSGGGGGLDDLFGSSSPSTSSSGAATTSSRPVIIPSSSNAGYEMRGSFEKNSSNDTITLELDITNNDNSTHPGQFQFQFQKNLFALAPGSLQCGPIQPGSTVHASLQVAIQKKQYQPQTKDPLVISVAVMNPVRPKKQNVSYGKIQISLDTVLSSTKGEIPKKEYIGKWKTLSGNQETNGNVKNLVSMDTDTIQANLRSKNIFHIASRQENGKTRMYLSGRVMAPTKEILIEVTLPPSSSGINGAKVCVKTEHTAVKLLVAQLVKNTLQGN